MKEIILKGNWKAGWAIDLHTISSVPLGDGKFNTIYTPIGGALNGLKYHHDFSQASILSKYAIDFLKTRLVVKYLNVILPVPPSVLEREHQPVYEVAERIGSHLQIPVDMQYLFKKKETSQLKNIDDQNERDNLLKEAFNIKNKRYKNMKILLFDDLYRSGSTLKAITDILYTEGKVQNVYVLTLTKTRVKK